MFSLLNLGVQLQYFQHLERNFGFLNQMFYHSLVGGKQEWQSYTVGTKWIDWGVTVKFTATKQQWDVMEHNMGIIHITRAHLQSELQQVYSKAQPTLTEKRYISVSSFKFWQSGSK